MLRTGDYKAGIVFFGQFISDPYPSEDWAGSTKRRMYVDLICMDPTDPRERPRISLEKLKKEILVKKDVTQAYVRSHRVTLM